MANIEVFAGAGLERLQYGISDSDGFFIGNVATLANGSDSGMGRLYYIQEFPFEINEAERVTITGDDGAQFIFIFPASELPSFTLSYGAEDLAFNVFVSQLLINAIGEWDIAPIGPDTPSPRDVWFLVTTKAQNGTVANKGAAGFKNVMLKGQVEPLSPSGLTSGANGHASRATVVVQKTNKLPWGESVTTSNFGTTSAIAYEWFSDNRISLHAFKSNAAALTFTLDETPAAASSDKVKVWKNGTLLTYTTDYTVTPATKTVTLVAAGSAGDDYVVLYEWVTS